ncbi:MAG TPA: dockerin type I repeat-containing protein [Clostridia bacterium]
MKRYILGRTSITPDFAIWDLNGDGKINSSDLSLLKRYILGSITAFPR